MSRQIVIDALLSGEVVLGHKESGNSMNPLIKNKQPFDIHPVNADLLEKGDIVMVKVKGRVYTHKVTAVRKGQVQIGNNHGAINGWTDYKNVYGIITNVDGREIKNSLTKIKLKIEAV